MAGGPGGGIGGGSGGSLLACGINVRTLAVKPSGFTLIIKPPRFAAPGGAGLKVLRPVRPRRPYVGSSPHYAVTVTVAPPTRPTPATLVVSTKTKARDGQSVLVRPPLSAPPSMPGGNRVPAIRVIRVTRAPEAGCAVWVRRPRPVPAPQTHLTQKVLIAASVSGVTPFQGYFRSVGAPLVALWPSPPVGGSSMTCSSVVVTEQLQVVFSMQEQMQGTVLLED